ncbi:winged helix-turn-helix domain-containing protein [Telmatobacter sp. DSM 110680]|uniref:Winged helix-turn-helix domain-containing protein n=1 Tax=Telmatobacter sp. DSM 110680 TaxID=3036704 RepID=A0AAU7DD65_9BACT
MSVERFQFGEFEFDTGTRALTHKGRLVKLQAQPAILLSVLLARDNQVVSREVLKQAIWGDDTYVDFEKGLNFCIAQIRSALRDNAARPLYIRTLPKQGYQFIAPVQNASVSSAALPGVNPAKTSTMRWIPLAGAAIGLAVLALGVVMYLSVASASNSPNLAIMRFDADSNSPQTQRLASNLTDDVVVQLASRSGGHYRVIGNAGILRAPREQRDLAAVASTLRCKYAVLGQVKADGNKILILAHLIRLSDLTHIEVVRIERRLDDPMTVESDAAARITSQFAAKMANHPEQAASFPSSGH